MKDGKIKCNNNLLFFLLLLFGYISPLQVNAQTEIEHPNILFILVDDLGWKDLGYMGSEIYETPNIDKLATEGMVFTDFYTGGPVCSPTRASILTGKSTARTGITTYLITPEKDPVYVTHQLELSEYTLAEALSDDGYVTGLFGKWHLGYDQVHWASHQGFDVAIGGSTSSNDWQEAFPGRPLPIPPDRYETYYFSPYYFTHMDDGPVGEYLTDRLTNETIKFIRENENQPFFAFLSFHSVHTPLVTKRTEEAKYRKKINEMKLLEKDETLHGSRKYQNLPEYAAMVQHVDYNIGRLLDSLRVSGMDKNTIVVFTSDNGGKGSVTSNAPLRGAKHNLYEGGIRVPLIIKWPNHIDQNTESSEPVISDDFYPTLLDLVGLPLQPEQHKDGLSFKKILTGEGEMKKRQALYWHYPHGVFQAAVREGHYKLVYHYKTGKSELFDLVNDLGENHDISDKETKRTQRMKKMLRVWLKDTGAKFPETGMVLP